MRAGLLRQKQLRTPQEGQASHVPVNSRYRAIRCHILKDKSQEHLEKEGKPRTAALWGLRKEGSQACGGWHLIL